MRDFPIQFLALTFQFFSHLSLFHLHESVSYFVTNFFLLVNQLDFQRHVVKVFFFLFELFQLGAPAILTIDELGELVDSLLVFPQYLCGVFLAFRELLLEHVERDYSLVPWFIICIYMVKCKSENLQCIPSVSTWSDIEQWCNK